MAQSKLVLRTAGISAIFLATACSDDPTTGGIASPDRISESASAVMDDPRGIAPLPQGRVIVRFKQGSAPGRAVAAEARRNAAAAFAARHGARLDAPLGLERAWLIETTPGTEDALAARLSDDTEIEFAEVDQPIILDPCETGTCVASNDPFRGYKWDLNNTGFILNSAGTNLGATGQVDADIDWLEAFDALGAAFAGAATIGVIDTGILPTHQDLTGRVVAARNLAAGYAVTLTADRHSHGTHVAGIAAARGNNATGVPGVAYGANIQLINAKACEWYLFPGNVVDVACFQSSVANAIVWATDNGANVLNLSLGGGAPSSVQQAALQYARARNVLPVCATGNNGSATSISYPAKFPECVAVGATNWSDARASYSNAGAEIALSAPGGDGASLPTSGNSLILATVPNLTLTSAPGTVETNSAYGFKAGTSMATPQVAGLAALLYSTGLTNVTAILARMKETSDDLGPSGWDANFGQGRINACRALDPAQVRIAMPGAIKMSDGTNAVVSVTLFGGPRFVVAQFDAANLTLGNGSGAEVAVSLKGDEFRSALEDVDLDGVMDLVLKFSRDALTANGDLAVGNRTLLLRGNVGCRRIEGQQTVKVRS